MIKALGDRLKALHIHDNDKLHDSHQLPFTMNIDFEPIVKALKETNYDGYFTLEASYYIENLKNPDIIECTKKLYNSAKRLAELYENL